MMRLAAAAHGLCTTALLVTAAAVQWPAGLQAQRAPATQQPPATPGAPSEPPPVGVTTASDYVIGAGDILGVVFWREKELSGDVAVRPDGLITLPLINDLKAAGLTPDELRQVITEEARKFVTNPTTSVVVRQINSRKVFITGEVEKPGTYQLNEPLSILQLIAMAGGLRQYADASKILVVRQEGGKKISLSFDYKQVKKRQNLAQDINLKPGDTVVVP